MQFPGRGNGVSSEHSTLKGLKKGQFSYRLRFRRVVLAVAWWIARISV